MVKPTVSIAEIDRRKKIAGTVENELAKIIWLWWCTGSSRGLEEGEFEGHGVH